MCVDFFKLGLKTWLHNAILNRRPIPRTLDQWQVTAREEVEAQALKKANIGAKPKYWLSARESLWQNSQTKTKEKEKKPRDPDAMDIDAVRTSNMSSKERQELMKDGKCFYCRNKGHRARDCPEKGKIKGKQKAQESRARSASIEEVEEEPEKEKEPLEPSKAKEDSPPKYDNKDHIRSAIRRMRADKREAFMDSLAEESF